MTEFLTPHNDAWYALLIDDLNTIITERTWNSNLEKITCKHEVGKRALEDHDNFERKFIYGKKIASVLSESISRKGWGRREIERCIKFAKMHPNLNTFWATTPKGKAITWNWIIKNILTESKGEENDKNGDKNTTIKSNKFIQGGAIGGKIETSSNPNFSSPDYLKWVKTQPCCVCSRPPPSDPAHFPVTKDSESEYWVIPLCRECHSLQHRDDLNFCWTYKRKWAKWMNEDRPGYLNAQ